MAPVHTLYADLAREGISIALMDDVRAYWPTAEYLGFADVWPDPVDGCVGIACFRLQDGKVSDFDVAYLITVIERHEFMTTGREDARGWTSIQHSFDGLGIVYLMSTFYM